jgi:hypothetical protein
LATRENAYGSSIDGYTHTPGRRIFIAGDSALENIMESFFFKKKDQAIKMDDDQTKTISKKLYDALLAYLIESSTTLDETARALAPDPLQSSRVDVLNDALDSARVLLSKVIHSYSNTFLIDFLSCLL